MDTPLSDRVDRNNRIIKAGCIDFAPHHSGDKNIPLGKFGLVSQRKEVRPHECNKSHPLLDIDGNSMRLVVANDHCFPTTSGCGA